MSYTLTMQNNGRYLFAKATGKNTLENVRAYLLEVLGACKETACHYVVIEENLDGPSLSLADVMRVVSIDGAEVLPFIHCIAYADVNPEHVRARMTFAGAAVRNQGLTMRTFETVAEAEKWLLEELESPSKT